MQNNQFFPSIQELKVCKMGNHSVPQKVQLWCPMRLR